MVQPPRTPTRDPLTRVDLGRDIDSAAKGRSKLLQSHCTGVSPKDSPIRGPAPHLPPDASSPPCHLMLGTTPDDYLGYQSRGPSLWSSSVDLVARAQLTWPPPIKTKLMNEKGTNRMKKSMDGVHPRATLRRMGWIDRG